MSLKDSIQRFIVMQTIERPARRKGLEGLTQKLEAAGERLSQKFAGITASKAGQTTLAHIIAIERWGQSRLRVALGEPLKDDGSRDYQPEASASWAELQAMFIQTRAETLNIARELAQQKVDPKLTVRHNQFGPISILAWLAYLEIHASLEARRKLN